MLTDDRPPFERQSGEPARAYHGFCHYRDLGPMRSLDRAWREHHEKCLHQVQPVTKRRPMSWGNWSARWGWSERAAAFDLHLDRQKRVALEQEQIEASKRHARALQATQNALLVPIRVALEEAASGAGLDMLKAAARANASGLRTAVDQARMAAAHLAELIGMERLVLGLTTSRDEIHDVPMHDHIAAAIVSSPDATHAAVQLLDAIARSTPATSESSS